MSRRGPLVVMVALAALVGLVLFRLRARVSSESEASSPETRDDDAGVGRSVGVGAAPGGAVVSGAEATALVPSASSAAGREVSTAEGTSPGAPSPPVDPCAEIEVPTRHDRLDELVNVRLAELRDRARLAIDDPATSPALREALVAVLVRGQSELAAIEPALSASDRVDDGFDLAAGLLLTVAVRLDHLEARGAEPAIDRAIRAAPDDAVPHVLLAIRRMHAEDPVGARAALGEAFARDRAEPAIAIELAYSLSRTVEHARALDAIEAYLAVYPGDAEALRLRARIERRRDGVGASSTRTEARGVTVLHPADVDRGTVLPVIGTIADALDEAARTLEVPRRDELAVLVHDDHEAMLRAMCGQRWTQAAYDGVLHLDRSLFARETSEEERPGVLRHETLHAALHARPREVPYWVDEGIAQRFSGRVDPSAEGDFARLVRDHTYVPLASLDGAFLDIDDPDDARLAYHQSLAMIDWLIAQRGPRGLAELVARLGSGPSTTRDPALILGEIAGRPFDGEVLLAFLASR
ncbi:MAG: hypothetical protein U0353_22505 [Sandaracinus sp.]